MDQDPDPNRCPCRLCGANRYRPVYYLDEVEIVQCRDCGLIQISSLVNLDDLRQYYARSGTTRAPQAPAFDQRKILRASRFRARYVQRYTGLRAGRVLEVGSAAGHFLEVMEGRGFQVMGIEPSLDGARRHREKGIPVINDLLEHAALPQAQFDAVCLFQVFEHFQDPKDAAQKLHAVLKPGGYLVLEIPDIHSTGAKFEKRPPRLFHREHLTYFSPDLLNALLTPLGFTPIVARHYDYDGFRIPCGKSLKKILVPLLNPKFRGPLEKILHQEMDLHYHSPPAPEDDLTPDDAPQSGRTRLKTLRKTLTAPLDMLCGYLAYLLDRGASLFWIGRKG